MTNALVSEMPNIVTARKTIAAPIKAHLAVADISGAEIGRRIGLSQSQMSRRLTGRLPFDSDDLSAIAAELHVSVVELIQMPTAEMVGGGHSLMGIAPLHVGWKLPHLDSNQEPAGSRLALVTSLADRLDSASDRDRGELAKVTAIR